MFYRCRNLSRDALRVYNLPLYNVLQTKIRFVYNFIENEFRKNMQNEKVHFQVGNFLKQQSMQSKIEILIRWHAMASHSLQLYFSQEIFGAPKIAAIFENAFLCDSMFVNEVLYGPDHLIDSFYAVSAISYHLLECGFTGSFCTFSVLNLQCKLYCDMNE